ncbi:MAG TPA: hypothetical protein VL128_03435 [Candidatus Eisenbacteria bacterium]|nr:hypothetical protein [Candidatus Eisenbacteria bacterium]
MALVPIRTASTTGYCDCVCGCYTLASLRDEDTGKGYCPACGKDHLAWNDGVGIPHAAPTKVEANVFDPERVRELPPGADPPARLR